MNVYVFVERLISVRCTVQIILAIVMTKFIAFFVYDEVNLKLSMALL